ncbi:ankyrin repeat-containing domain protein [Bombardia bombarda]|uniref:Ankyrin repeat-containing domain protein n=1 Tax=Bombardia bombarda TaxID=252184 RepID=A0AA39X0H5_9PEZI|nr:ankyrin repeat-containing domain protein [Bombardia bombarda]
MAYLNLASLFERGLITTTNGHLLRYLESLDYPDDKSKPILGAIALIIYHRQHGEMTPPYDNAKEEDTRVHHLPLPNLGSWTEMYAYKSLVEHMLLIDYGISSLSPVMGLPALTGISAYLANFAERCRNGHGVIFAELFKHDPYPFRPEKKGLTSLHWAVSAGHDHIANQLLSHTEQHTNPSGSALTRYTDFYLRSVLRGMAVQKAQSIITVPTGKGSLFGSYTEQSDKRSYELMFQELYREWTIPALKGSPSYITADEPRREILLHERKELLVDPFFKQFILGMMYHWSKKELNTAILSLLLGLNVYPAERMDEDYLLHGCNDVGVINLLVSRGANVNARDFKREGMTPLHQACLRYDSEVVAALLSVRGIEVDALTEDKDTALMLLLRNADKNEEEWPKMHDICVLLLSKGASPHVVDTQGRSAVQLAMDAPNPVIIMTLLSVSVEIGTRRLDRLPMLHALARAKWASCWSSISPEDEQATEDINLVHEGQTPLSLAMLNKNWTLAYILLDRGGTLPGMPKSDKVLPVHTQRRRATHYRSATRSRRRPLHVPPYNESTPPLVAALPAHGAADPRTANWLGRTPLHSAVLSHRLETVTLLLRAGADVHQTAVDCPAGYARYRRLGGEYYFNGHGWRSKPPAMASGHPTPLGVCLQECVDGVEGDEAEEIVGRLVEFGADGDGDGDGVGRNVEGDGMPYQQMEKPLVKALVALKKAESKERIARMAGLVEVVGCEEWGAGGA